MTKQRMIEILRMTADAFWKEPSEELYNDSGLCWYWNKNLYQGDRDEYYEIRLLLGSPKGDYLFANKHSQDYAWKKDSLRAYRYDRARWCEQKIRELKEEE